MLTCKQVVKQMSGDKKSSVFYKIEIFFHLIICKYCKTYVVHLKMVSDGFRKSFYEKIKNINNSEILEVEKKVMSRLKKNKSE